MTLARFTPLGSGALLARFEPIEIDLLRLATRQLLEMLGAGVQDPTLASSDGVFGRLLPDAYRDDVEAAAEFRRFTATGLLERKAHNARVLLHSLGTELNEPDPVQPDSTETEALESDPAEAGTGTGTGTGAGAGVGTGVSTDTAVDTNSDDGTPPHDSRLVTVSLAPDAVQAWLRSLTDLRLTLANRLQVSPDGAVHLQSDDAPFLRELYEWLGMLQEELVYAIDV